MRPQAKCRRGAEMKALGDYVRTIPDFPKPGIMFRDITTILQDPDGLKMAIDGLIDLVKDLDYDVVVGPEARGFIFGVPVAYAEHKSFVPIRKKGKLPAETVEMTYDLEYGTATIEIHKDAIKPGQKVIIVDDLIATGGTTEAIVRLIESEDADYCVRIHRNNTVKNICFSGGLTAPSDFTTPDTDLGNRHGVYLAANADGQSATHTGSLTNIVTGCFFENFDGSGFYAEDTGGSMDNAVIMSDCRFYNCKVGINLDYYTEYSKFANCIVYSSNVACINNGGNNVFTACTFHGVKGFVIDNSNNDKRNCAHGSVIGCTFNHIDNANRASTLGGGNAIEIKGITNAFVFSGCQLWYGAIDISNSRGVSFSNCLLGGNAPAITVSGDYGVTFCGCTFHQMPELNVNAGTKFDSCYVDYTGEAVYPNSAITSLINNGAKNLIDFKSGSNTLPTRWIDIPCTVSQGEYVISFESLTSTDTDTTVCQMALFDGTTARSKWQNLNRGTNISANVSVLGNTTHIRIYASDSYAHSENDTVTVANAMLCTKDNWDMSHDYVDYCPTVKVLYQMIKDLQSQS